MSNIFSFMQICSPVVCSCDSCSEKGKYINFVSFVMNSEDSFYEGFGNGAEAEKDYCPVCSNLGELLDPIPFFFLSSRMRSIDCVFGIKMNLSLVQRMVCLLKNFQEETSNCVEKVYSAADSMCDCFSDFHVFETGTDSSFHDGSWDFDKPPFDEKTKVVIVTKDGVRFFCDISTKGDNPEYLGSPQSRLLCLDDLTKLEGWLVERKVVA